MPYLLGTDEAGYGPNLGPLVISATLWQIPDTVVGASLHEYLPSLAVSADRSRSDTGRLVIGDSKMLYRPGGKLAALERGVLAALAVASDVVPSTAETTARTADGTAREEPGCRASALPVPATWREVFHRCDPLSVDAMEQISWYQSFERELPVDASCDSISAACDQLLNSLSRIGVRLVEIQSRVIYPEAFNCRIKMGENKATALSLWTLDLVHSLVSLCDAGPVLIQADKHGGRNRYAPLLQRVFPDYLVETVAEGKLRSVYRWGPADHRVEAQFVAKGDRFFPAALASMTSKYLRELAMMAFNAFWCGRLPGLRATAGYPVDAARFRREITALQQELQIPDVQLWRDR